MVQECLNCLDLRKRIAELESKLFSLEKSRGEDIISVDRVDDSWHIVAHRDVDGVVKTLNYYIPHSNVLLIKRFLLHIFNDSGKAVFSGRSKELAELKQMLVMKYEFFNDYGNHYSNKEFFGSRSSYFDTYYYPLKILSHFRIIDYTNSGKISLLKKFFDVQGDL